MNFRTLLLLALAPAAAWSQSYTFTAIAGQPPRVGSADGTGAQARFFEPRGTAVDKSGNIYVADTFNHLIRKISPTGVVTTVAGTPGERGTVDGPARSARFSDPENLTIDVSGNLYVTGSDDTIRKITPAGVVSTLAGTAGKSGRSDGTGSAALFSHGPKGLVTDSSGNVFVADWGNDIVRKITPAGVVSTYAGVFGRQGVTDGPVASATFTYPNAIAIDTSGNLYVSSGSADLSNVVRKITPGGIVSTLPGSDCGPQVAIRGIAVDSGGNLLISASNFCIRRLTPAGLNTVFVGSAGDSGNQDGIGTNARLRTPWGISIDGEGNLYLASGLSPVIRKISAAGVVTTFAGQASVNGSADGNGLAARFNRPVAITGDSAGNLFVADSDNCAIRQISPNGDVTTLVGSPSTPGDLRAAPPTSTRDTWKGPTLAIDSSGNLFGVAFPSSKVLAISPAKAVTTLGIAGPLGPVDGPSGVAKFGNTVCGVAVDGTGNLFVTDGNSIRKIARDGYVSTIAGSSFARGSADGAGSSARFNFPTGIVVDRNGSLFVSDTNNDTIRKITPDGVVSTLAGSAGSLGSNTDGVGAQARFSRPAGLAFDAAGNLFVADSNNGSVRKISPAGAVTTLSGFSWTDYYYSDGTGARARFLAPGGMWVSPQGDLYITDRDANVIVKGVLDRPPAISAPPESASVLIGNAATFSVTASGGGLAYQWKLNGDPIAGATNATYTITGVAPSHAGNYTVDISNPVGAITSAGAALVVTTPGRLINLSVLTALASANDSFTVGLTVGGAGASGPKPLLLRAMGPSLSSFGVPNTVPGTLLAVYTGTAKTDENSGWRGDAGIAAASTRVGAFAFASPSSGDSAIYLGDAAGPGRTLTIAGTAAGTALAEVYDATAPAAYTLATPRLINLSVLKTLTGGLTAGFGIGGNTSLKVLVRAVGPALSGYGVVGAVAKPRLEVFDAGGKSLATNAGWGGAPAVSAAFTLSGAFPLDPASADAVLLLELSPGTYTVKATAADGVNGLALVEIYEVP